MLKIGRHGVSVYVDSFRGIYDVNLGKNDGVAAATGRYPEDVYMGGNVSFIGISCENVTLFSAMVSGDLCSSRAALSITSYVDGARLTSSHLSLTAFLCSIHALNNAGDIRFIYFNLLSPNVGHTQLRRWICSYEC